MRIRKIRFLLLIFFVSNFIISQDKIDKELLKKDLDVLKANLEAYHTGLYTYTSKEEFEQWYSDTKMNLEDATSLEFFRKLMELNTLIKNGHTRFHLNPEQRGKDLLMPSFNIYKDKDLFYIKECDNPELIGKQIATIDKMPIAEVFEHLLNFVERDGNNLTQPTDELVYSFSRKYPLAYGNSPKTRLEIWNDQEIEEIVFTNIPYEGLYPKTDYLYDNGGVEFSIKDSVALLTVQTFNPTPLKKDNYLSKLKTLFTEIEKEKIKHLIIDVRNNGGGATKPVEELISYIYGQEFIFYEDVYQLHKKWDTSIIPESSRYSKITAKWAYKKGEDGHYRAIAGNDGMKKRKPKKNYFQGELYVLINGSSLSAAAEFASFIKQYRKATFIGDEAGGNKTQNTSGRWLILVLPNSKIYALIPFVLWKMNVNFENDGHGIKPDYYIQNSIQEEIKNEDAALQFTYELIKQSTADKGNQ